MEKASAHKPWSVPRDPSPWASPPPQPAPRAPVSSLPSSPLLCFQPPRSPSPAVAAVPPRPPSPGWRGSLCLTGSRPGSGALRLLLAPAQLLPEEAGRAARTDPRQQIWCLLATPGKLCPAAPAPLQVPLSTKEPESSLSCLAPCPWPTVQLPLAPSTRGCRVPSCLSTSPGYLLFPPSAVPRSSCGSGGWCGGHPGSASTVSLHHSRRVAGLRLAKKRVNLYFPINTQPPLDSLTQAARRRGRPARWRPALPCQLQQAFQGQLKL